MLSAKESVGHIQVLAFARALCAARSIDGDETLRAKAMEPVPRLPEPRKRPVKVILPPGSLTKRQAPAAK